MAKSRAGASVLVAVAALALVAGATGRASSTASHNAADWKCNVAAPASHVTVHFYGWTFPIMDYYANELKQCSSVKNISVTTQLLDSATVDKQVALALGSGSSSPYDIIHASNPRNFPMGA